MYRFVEGRGVKKIKLALNWKAYFSETRVRSECHRLACFRPHSLSRLHCRPSRPACFTSRNCFLRCCRVQLNAPTKPAWENHRRTMLLICLRTVNWMRNHCYRFLLLWWSSTICLTGCSLHLLSATFGASTKFTPHCSPFNCCLSVIL